MAQAFSVSSGTPGFFHLKKGKAMGYKSDQTKIWHGSKAFVFDRKEAVSLNVHIHWMHFFFFPAETSEIYSRLGVRPMIFSGFINLNALCICKIKTFHADSY